MASSMIALLIIPMYFGTIVASSPHPVEVIPAASATILQLPFSLSGPYSLAFDSNGEGPYAGVTGRILKYQGSQVGFAEFAATCPQGTTVNTQACADVSAASLSACGRPLSIAFYNETGQLYIADAYKGLLTVGADGGQATQLATGADGVPFNFLIGLDVDPTTGDCYLTQATSTYPFGDLYKLLGNPSSDATGSLYKYDQSTKQATTLLKNLAIAAGVAVSSDGSFVLVSEYYGKRILKYWLKGPKANTSEVFKEFKGFVNNIKRNSKGEFWVAVTVKNEPPKPGSYGNTYESLGYRLSKEGWVLQVVSFAPIYGIEAISEVQELNGKLYVGSLHVSFASII